MTEKENLIMQFTRAAYKAETPQDIADAVYSLQAGAWNKIADFIIDYCDKYGIDKHAPEIAAFYQEAEEYRAKEAREQKKKAAADLAAQIANYQENINVDEIRVDDPKLVELTQSIEKNVTALGNIPTIDRIGTWEGYITECITYEPEKDFRPKLFNGLAFPPGTISYIGARAKVGKTTAMINLGREALFDNRKVFFITLEMSRKQLLTKLVLCTAYSMAAAEKISVDLDAVETPMKDFYNFLKNKTGQDENFQVYIRKAIEIIRPKYKTNFFIYDGRGAAFNEIMNAIKTNATPGTLILVDYVQRLPSVDGDKSDSYTRVKYISDGLFNTATRTESIIISGAQFNRDTSKKRAMDGAEVVELTDFRESGDIEQDGHNLIGIGRLAGQGERYIKMLAARESMVEDNAYSLHFAGAYSYMAINEKIPAPESAPTNGQGTGLGIGRLNDREKEIAINSIKVYRDQQHKKTSKGEIITGGNW
jgi:hypothetical protein